MCGGVIADATLAPASRRDALYRALSVAAPQYQIILAETATPLTTEAGYKDLFSFESDIAQVVGLILLFVESPGSFAELGAFAALKSVAPRVLAIVDDFFYNQKSFIHNGPILHLENEYGEESILELNRKEIGISDDGGLEFLSLNALSSAVLPVIDHRLENIISWSKFDHLNSGHIILLVIGLCQEFGALMISEIKSYLVKFGLNDVPLNNYLYCAQLLGWLKKIRRGHHIFYIGVPDDFALDYKVKEARGPHDKIRWRADVRSYWQKHDSSRFKVISETVLGKVRSL